MIAENVQNVLKEIAGGNAFGEKITLVAATKTRTPEEINEAIAAGVTDIGENKVQEFRAKYDLVHGANTHFIGHLQTNKVKYLIGKGNRTSSIIWTGWSLPTNCKSAPSGAVELLRGI